MNECRRLTGQVQFLSQTNKMTPQPLFIPQTIEMGRKRKHAERTENSNQPVAKKQNTATDLPPGVHHYQSVEEVPWDIQKYETPPDQ